MDNPSSDKEKEILDGLEPGKRDEVFNPFDWCLAGGCGCGGCLDPTGCLDAASQGCLGCLDACLARLGCGVLVIGAVVLTGMGVWKLLA